MASSMNPKPSSTLDYSQTLPQSPWPQLVTERLHRVAGSRMLDHSPSSAASVDAPSVAVVDVARNSVAVASALQDSFGSDAAVAGAREDTGLIVEDGTRMIPCWTKKTEGREVEANVKGTNWRWSGPGHSRGDGNGSRCGAYAITIRDDMSAYIAAQYTTTQQ